MMGVLNKISECMIFNLLRSLVNWGTLLELLADLERYLVCLQGHLYIAQYESCNGEVDIGIWHFKEQNATFTF